MGIDPKAVDPEDLHDFNRYAYANNNPYKFVDPDGKNPVVIFAIARVIAQRLVTFALTRGAQASVMATEMAAGDALGGASLAAGAAAGAKAIKRGAEAVQAGQVGEAVSSQLAGMSKNTVRIPSASGKTAYRVPDHMDDAQRHIIETKNVDYQYYSSQLKDDKAHVLREGGPGRVDVMIDERTTISPQLLREHLNPGSPIKLRSEKLNE